VPVRSFAICTCAEQSTAVNARRRDSAVSRALDLVAKTFNAVVIALTPSEDHDSQTRQMVSVIKLIFDIFV